MTEAIIQGVPPLLQQLVIDVCRMPADQFRIVPAAALPPRARELLDHPRDMTSTLGAHHGDALGVDVLQEGRVGDLYCREVFLRTRRERRIVEYGVIAIRLEAFNEEQAGRIREGRIPLGALLHEFRMPFESSPICFFSVTSAGLAKTRFGSVASNGPPCFGRFNHLATPAGEPLAWIMEILP